MTVDPEQLANLFRREAAFVMRTLRRFGVRDTDLEDVTQEVFLVVFRKHETFEGRSCIRSWLYGIARRCASSHRKRAHTRREMPSADPLAGHVSEAGGQRSLEQRETLAKLRRVLEGLPAAQREVYALYEIEEFSMPEIAVLLEVPLNTCYARLRRARAAVREAFTGEADHAVA